MLMKKSYETQSKTLSHIQESIENENEHDLELWKHDLKCQAGTPSTCPCWQKAAAYCNNCGLGAPIALQQLTRVASGSLMLCSCCSTSWGHCCIRLSMSGMALLMCTLLLGFACNNACMPRTVIPLLCCCTTAASSVRHHAQAAMAAAHCFAQSALLFQKCKPGYR